MHGINHTASELCLNGVTDLELGLIVTRAMKKWRNIDEFDNINISAVDYWMEIQRLGSLVRELATDETVEHIPDLDGLDDEL